MCTPSMPRLLAGLAATALAAGLGTAPMIAYAEPTQTPTPGSTASATPSAAPSPNDTGATSPSPSDSVSVAPSTQTSPSETATPSPSQSGTTTAARRTGSDALAAPGPAAEEPAEERVEVLQVADASITLAKTASPTRVSRVGQVVSYRFVATNDGAVALSDVRITDQLEGLGPIDCDRAEPVTLQPGETLGCSATLTVTQADLDFGAIYNFASVFGQAAGVEEPSEDIGAVDDAAVQVDQRPSIGLSASVRPTGKADWGDRLRYRATATNTGNVTLSAARITSSLDALDLDCDPSARATLAPGATISCSGSYRVTSADARRGRVTNELTARAERPFGDPDFRGDDVTDDVRLRVAVTKLVDAADGGLANTGGPALPLGLAGLLSVAGGVALIRRARRA